MSPQGPIESWGDWSNVQWVWGTCTCLRSVFGICFFVAEIFSDHLPKDNRGWHGKHPPEFLNHLDWILVWIFTDGLVLLLQSGI